MQFPPSKISKNSIQLLLTDAFYYVLPYSSDTFLVQLSSSQVFLRFNSTFIYIFYNLKIKTISPDLYNKINNSFNFKTYENENQIRFEYNLSIENGLHSNFLFTLLHRFEYEVLQAIKLISEY